ncbi:MAG: hypothetical protein MI861_24570 [Pirellulales bacterium]|nr:hypothetical protein [Pirellulales bacterium]
MFGTRFTPIALVLSIAVLVLSIAVLVLDLAWETCRSEYEQEYRRSA